MTPAILAALALAGVPQAPAQSAPTFGVSDDWGQILNLLIRGACRRQMLHFKI